MKPISVDDWVEWALSVPIPAQAASIGQSSTRLVLVALALNASSEGYAFPSAQTLADKIHGMHRWDARNGLKVLESAGVIARAGRAGRAVRWHLKTLNPPVYPVTSGSDDVEGEVADDVAGELAGELAGYPATNLKEQNRTPSLPPQRKRNAGRPALGQRGGENDLILRDLASQGLDTDEAGAVLEYAMQDSTTTNSVRGRLGAAAYLSHCRQAVKADQASTRNARPKCLDHTSEIAENCRSCKADCLAGQRDRRYIGKQQPQCSICFNPLVNYPDGATTCDNCPQEVSA